MRAVATTIALRTADENVAEELHFDFLEARAAATLALALGRIEAERAGGKAALLRQLRLAEEFANGVKGANVNGGVGSRRATERGLIDEHNLADRSVAADFSKVADDLRLTVAVVFGFV